MSPEWPVFLSATWKHLVMLNYPVDEAILKPYLPAGCELDRWNGQSFVSIVAFQFLDTRIGGWRIPFHVNFEELNLRFYVRRRVDGEERRGVVFIKELVPRFMIAWVARTLYHENYYAHPNTTGAIRRLLVTCFESGSHVGFYSRRLSGYSLARRSLQRPLSGNGDIIPICLQRGGVA